jgi:hypothetical protein
MVKKVLFKHRVTFRQAVNGNALIINAIAQALQRTVVCHECNVLDMVKVGV